MTVFYLKYRPQKIADLDLSGVKDILAKILSSKTWPQSYLFCGPKGSGKTSAARIFAKTINCQSREAGEACGKCEMCKTIEKGGMVDIMEIDAASNRGIDEVRGLKEKIYSSPVYLKNKVFVVDEVHMMTKEAFNALLKILEEPPKGVYFILCTTNPEKIPETVLSRLIRIDFTKSTVEEMVGSLEKVVKGEQIILGKDENLILEAIAGLSEGSFRNGQKMLMELVMDKGKKINKDDWQDFYQKKFSQGSYEPKDFEKDLLENDCATVIGKIEKMAEGGVDLQMYRQKLIEYFQKKLVDYFVNRREIGLINEENNYLLKLLIQAGKDEKNSIVEQLPLQLAVVDFFEKYKRGNKKPPEIKKEKEDIKEEIKKEVKLNKIDKSLMGIKIELDEIKNKWKDLLVAVRPYNHSVEAFLRAARPVELEDGRLVIEVFYKFHKERLEDQRNRRIVEKGLEQILGTPFVFECRLTDKGTPVDLVAETQANTGELYDVAKEIFG